MRLDLAIAPGAPVLLRRVSGAAAPQPWWAASLDDAGGTYDLSDRSTLFQDADAVLPVRGDGDPVGLILDRGPARTLGPEALVGGGFDDGLGPWISDGDHWVGRNGVAVHSWSDVFRTLRGAIPAGLRGRLAEFAFEVKSMSGRSGLRADMRRTDNRVDLVVWGTGGARPAAGRGGQRAILRVPPNAAFVAFARDGAGEHMFCNLDDVSLREVRGAHLAAPVGAPRPIWRTDGRRGWLETAA